MKTSIGGSTLQGSIAALLFAGVVCIEASAAVIDSSWFATRVDFESQRDPASPVLADLDGDGKLDMIVPVYQSHVLTIRQNTSVRGTIDASSFGPRIDLPSGPSPAHVAAGDLDGDGRLDLVTANDYGANVSIYRNLSTGGRLTASSFAPPIHLAGDTHPISTAIGDLDGDGRPDLAVANAVHGQSTVSVYRNLTPNTATSGVSRLSFAPEVRFPVGHYAFNIALGDLDGDGKQDLVTANIETHNISILRNTARAGVIDGSSFAPKLDLPVSASSRAFDVALGDLDGDSKLDVAVAHDNAASIFRNTSRPGTLDASSFARRLELPFPGEVGYEVAIGDIDQDGRPDLGVTVNWAPTVSLYQNFSATGALEFGSRITLPGMANGITFGDVDRDGRLDVVTALNPAVSIYRNRGPEDPGSDLVAAVERLIGMVVAAELDRKAEQALLASLDAAKASFEAGRREAGHNQLEAFQNKVEAQLSRSKPELAQVLVDAAQDVIEGTTSQRVYDLSRDFSPLSNPAGAWSHGYSAALGGTFVPFGVFKYNYDSFGTPVEVWCIATWTVPAVQRNATSTTVYSDGGQGVYPPGTVWYYPGPSNRDDGGYNPNDNFGVLRFTVPAGEGGSYGLETAVRSAYTGPISGDTDFHVLVNGREIFGRFLPREGSASYNTQLTLRAGDTVDFVIGRGADDSFHGSGLIIDATLVRAAL